MSKYKRNVTEKDEKISQIEDAHKSKGGNGENFQLKPTKNYASVSTQYEMEIKYVVDPPDVNEEKHLDVWNEIIPQISSVIEKSEENLKKAFQNVLASSKISEYKYPNHPTNTLYI